MKRVSAGRAIKGRAYAGNQSLTQKQNKKDIWQLHISLPFPLRVRVCECVCGTYSLRLAPEKVNYDGLF